MKSFILRRMAEIEYLVKKSRASFQQRAKLLNKRKGPTCDFEKGPDSEEGPDSELHLSFAKNDKNNGSGGNGNGSTCDGSNFPGFNPKLMSSNRSMPWICPKNFN